MRFEGGAGAGQVSTFHHADFGDAFRGRGRGKVHEAPEVRIERFTARTMRGTEAQPA